MGKKRILVVEDEIDLADLMDDQLSVAGYQVLRAKDAKEGKTDSPQRAQRTQRDSSFRTQSAIQFEEPPMNADKRR